MAFPSSALPAIVAATKAFRKVVETAPTGLNNRTPEASAGALAVLRAAHKIRQLLTPSNQKNMGDRSYDLCDSGLPYEIEDVLVKLWNAILGHIRDHIAPFRNDHPLPRFHSGRRLPLMADDRRKWLVLLKDVLSVLDATPSPPNDGKVSIELVAGYWEIHYGNERRQFPAKGNKCLQWLAHHHFEAQSCNDRGRSTRRSLRQAIGGCNTARRT